VLEGGVTKLRVLDLFSGIGAFSLGLQWSDGFQTVAFCEINDHCRRVLARHWPGVPIYDDVQELTADRLAADRIAVDVICAGFPCQDISNAGLRAGIDGERSGLWRHVARLAGELRPRYVLLENVAALLDRGMGRVLGDLAEVGFDAEWDCIPASHIGAPHNRDRVWIVAHAQRGERWAEQYRWAVRRMGRQQQPVAWHANWEDALRHFRGVDDGTSYGVERLDSIRNSIVPHIPEIIGRAILAAEAA
jgi:DNA (cytosine-5)-methyltransferase 1